MDDETAEIELLEQNLNKTRQISQRMTSILSSFDTRLVKLEKSILPLYNSTQILTKRGNNIESALSKIDEIASNQEGIAAEEALILRGPQPGQLDEYKDVLERLNASVVFKSIDRDFEETARLVETGTKKLVSLYTKLVAEASSGAPHNGPDFEFTPFSAPLLTTLVPLVTFLRTMPVPATHPSHPAAPAILASLKEAQKGYADMRGAWGRKCVEQYAKRVVDRAETLDGVIAGSELGVWVGNLLSVAEYEYSLLSDLATMPGQPALSSTYASLISPMISLFSSTLSSLNALIKRSLNKNTLLALSAFSSLSTAQSRWDDVMCRRAGRKENELKDSLHTIRAACLRSFPELIADIRAAANGRSAELSTGLAEVAVSTVQYMERMPEVQDAVGSCLHTLGDGNWKMGEGLQVAKGGQRAELDERTVLEHFFFDVVNFTITSLLTLSRTNKRPSFGSIFLLNNISFLRSRLLVNPQVDIPSLLSKPSQDVLTSNFRTAKAAYFDSNFSPLMQTLQDDRDKSKSAAKEKFTRFFELLEEVAERHRLAKVLQDDKESREQICEEVVKLIVPSLQRMTQKTAGKEFKNPQKYIKMSIDEVESLVRSFYADSDPRAPAPAERAQNNLLIQAGWAR